MGKNIIKDEKSIELQNNIKLKGTILERRATKFGSSAHVVIGKKHLHKKVYVVVPEGK